MAAPPFFPPIAHRGLHDAKAGIIENTASAFMAAIAGRYAIETDIQAAASGEPFVFHDERLERLTSASGRVRDMSAAQLSRIALRGTGDRILPLAELFELVRGRAKLFLEIKSSGCTERTLERRVAELLKHYSGPACVMSFDPASMTAMRHFARQVPRGLSAMRFGKLRKCGLTAANRFRLTHMLDILTVKPDFLTYEVNDLAVMEHALRRRFPQLPIITWTVRTAEERRKAAQFADGMIFEGFRPVVPPASIDCRIWPQEPRSPSV